MKKKQRTQKQICSYILEQLQGKTNLRLTKSEAAAFRIFWETQEYRSTAYQLGLTPHQAINLINRGFKKLRIGKLIPDFRDHHDLLSAPIFIHPFSTRLYHVLRSMDCKCLYELCTYSKKRLMGKRGFGKKSWDEIDSYLKKRGLMMNGLLDIADRVIKSQNMYGYGKSIISRHLIVGKWWEKDFSRSGLLDAFGLGALERGLLNAPDINKLPEKVFQEFPEFLKYKVKQ